MGKSNLSLCPKCLSLFFSNTYKVQNNIETKIWERLTKNNVVANRIIFASLSISRGNKNLKHAPQQTTKSGRCIHKRGKKKFLKFGSNFIRDLSQNKFPNFTQNETKKLVTTLRNCSMQKQSGNKKAFQVMELLFTKILHSKNRQFPEFGPNVYS